ncbi:hypothetical protein NQZ68_015160 [Dissostichus eleginoides]|nr:hypothetical protein NQZ68_015160 [Dissostichus eleginoides]
MTSPAVQPDFPPNKGQLSVLLVVKSDQHKVVKLRHGCQDLTAERRRQSVDTHSNG